MPMDTFQDARAYLNAGTDAKPQPTAYRETIRACGEQLARLICQTSGPNHYADVRLRLEPNPGKGCEFVNAVAAEVILPVFIATVPQSQLPGVEEAVQGRARFKTGSAGYVEMPPSIADGIIKQQ
jgi:translation elongation factor EF-G